MCIRDRKNGVELSVSRAGYAAIQNAYLEWKGQYVDELSLIHI